jgi:thymidylate kinase
MMNSIRPPMDGPNIAWMYKGEEIKGISAYLCKMEKKLYRKIRPPDYLVVLHVSPNVSLKRKQDLSQAEAEAKIQAIESMNSKDLQVIHIDADQPFRQTVLKIKSALWKIL